MEARKMAADSTAPTAAAGASAIPIAAYVADRLDPQIAWYESKATRAKRTYWWLTVLQFGGAALVPVLNALSSFDRTFLYLSSGSAALAALATGFLILQRPMEHWIRYRNASTMLASYRTRHAYRTKPFDTPDADRRLIDMVEHEIASENDTWAVEMRRSGTK
jgi:hypothetical protein